MSENTITITNSLIGNTIVYEGSTVIDNRTFVAVQYNETDRKKAASGTAKEAREIQAEASKEQESSEEVSVRDVIDIPSKVVKDDTPEQSERSDLPVTTSEDDEVDVWEVQNR